MRKFILSMVFILIITMGCGTLAFAENNQDNEQQYTIDEPYEYPIMPGTDEWVTLDSTFDRIAVCQIPENILNKMTTEALVKTVLEYPFLMDLLASEDTRHGFLVMIDQFNGLKELSNRQDAIDYLAQEYNNIVQTSVTSMNKGEIETKEILYGILLQQPELGSETVTIAYETPEYRTKTIYTLAGSKLTVRECTKDYSKEQRDYMDKQYKKKYPTATLLKGATATYNCYSYAFYGKGARAWIDTPQAKVFMSDGSWTKVNQSAAKAGYVVYYDGGAHAGYVDTMSSITNNIIVESKWGPYGVYRHKIKDCPPDYVPSNVKFTFWK